MICVLFILLVTGISCDPSRRNKSLHNRRRSKAEFQSLVSKLWRLDKNRVQFGRDYNLSYQGKAVYGRDNAPRPLISNLNSNVLKRPTVKALISLMDNYNRVENQAEDITAHEIRENNHFLDLVIKSDVMQAVYSFLKKKRRASTNPSTFRKKLYRLWFGPYSRRRKSKILDSSGFEHVFMGEIPRKSNVGKKPNVAMKRKKVAKKPTVGGFHNWIRLYFEEQSNHLNYVGYLKLSKSSPLALTFRFTWYGTMKPIGGCFFGTSPEFELSLYTAVFMMGYNSAIITLDGLKLKIICWSQKRNKYIGTCYPAMYQ